MSTDRQDPSTPTSSGVRTLSEAIGANVRAQRIAASLTQQALADQIGLARTTLAGVEGGASIDADKLVGVCAALGVGVVDLLMPREGGTLTGVDLGGHILGPIPFVGVLVGADPRDSVEVDRRTSIPPPEPMLPLSQVRALVEVIDHLQASAQALLAQYPTEEPNG